ncbi:MAG: phenylalanine--tRNA ligase subunit alpha [Halobacteriovoraceae bacterium]|nr:phenylalanine--tRNA ligase subunit alpha [Peredibacter sp.]MBJ00804.1 phenylalanine--tRNA ligase subunit alpha [Halobacteriovoraceae bacterium]|tara:strand:- start:1829 stop:2863 length:1035 start_codon:yes stop_codon:yes gene_type:complete
MLEKIESLFTEFKEQITKVDKQADVLNLKSSFIGKKGALSEILKSLKDATPEQRKAIGPKSNEVKQQIEKMVQDRLREIELKEVNEKLEKSKIDFSLTDSVLDKGLNTGGIHPVHQIQREVEDIFQSMGFEVLDGPHIEDDWHNFGALNIPETHPARDMQDTFWFKDKKHLLRTHTSTIQVRGMETRKPPFKFVGPGKVFRCERTDATHEMCFHQLEGMMVGKDITVGNLIYFMKTLLKEIFKKDMEVRLRPGFFPFVEPGFELDIRWKKPKKGESRHSGWLELLPCGMVHPNVLKAGGIDPEKYNGFAFGLGLDRLVMVKNAIEDIRHLHSGDLRFNKQFSSY